MKYYSVIRILNLQHGCLKEKNRVFTNSVTISCPVCESGQLIIFFEMLEMPIFSNIIHPNKEDALNCPKGDIKLGFCSKCGYIANTAFDRKLVNYEQEVYENPLDYSPHYQDYSLSLARQLIERYDLHGKYIIGIGSGNGNFLNTLCELGNNHGVGFDPSCVKGTTPIFEKDYQVSFIKDYYSQKYKNYPVDLIVCSQTLEHVPNPKTFLFELRKIIGNRLKTGIFFEVPNALNILSRNFCWDVVYEHNSYFTSDSLSAIFSLSKFNVCEIAESFEGQFLCVYAEPNDRQQNRVSPGINPSKLVANIGSLNINWQNKIDAFRNKLEEIKKDRQRCIVWGAGSKAVTFLNVFKESPIEYSVDLNPHKQGNFIAGTGQQIIPPKFLLTYKPDVIIIMNPIYANEIQALLEELSVSSNIVCA